MHIYSKIHATKAALEGHQAKILLREGKAITKKAEGGFRLYYYFPSEKDARPYYQVHSKSNSKTKGFRYDIMSPDGFTIRIPDKGLFKSFEEAIDYFENWKKRFEAQGYYSSNFRRIPLEDLIEECQLIEIG